MGGESEQHYTATLGHADSNQFLIFERMIAMRVESCYRPGRTKMRHMLSRGDRLMDRDDRHWRRR
jgi:hypothetical protein